MDRSHSCQHDDGFVEPVNIANAEGLDFVDTLVPTDGVHVKLDLRCLPVPLKSSIKK